MAALAIEDIDLDRAQARCRQCNAVFDLGEDDPLRHRDAPAALSPEAFRALGHRLVDRLGDFIATLPARAIRNERSPQRIQELLAADRFPEHGTAPAEVFDRAADLLCNHAVSTVHPRFWAYIMGAASPIAALADLLASAVSPPMTSYPTSALTVAMEAQTVRWIAELLGFPTDCGGLFLSGGSVANLVAMRAALHVKAGWDVRESGVTGAAGERLRLYATKEAHTSIVAAAQLCGLGSRAIQWIPADDRGRMIPEELHRHIRADVQAGHRPFLVIAIAGTTGTGAVDPLPAIADICRAHDLWYHVDGAYGGFAVLSPDAPDELRELRDADSLVVDPHKWLYIPADVGCLLTRDRRVLHDAFRQGAPYYAQNDEQALFGGPEAVQLRELGVQTSRSFRALKVRLSLQSIGRDGYARMISDDIRLARRLYELVARAPALEPLTHGLGITTFRYVPPDLAAEATSHQGYLNTLNEQILRRLQSSGAAFPSHTSLQGRTALRVCIVNYNTTLADIEALPAVVSEIGAELDADQRPRSL